MWFTSQYQYVMPEILLQVRHPRRPDQILQADNHGAENRGMQRHGECPAGTMKLSGLWSQEGPPPRGHRNMQLNLKAGCCAF